MGSLGSVSSIRSYPLQGQQYSPAVPPSQASPPRFQSAALGQHLTLQNSQSALKTSSAAVPYAKAMGSPSPSFKKVGVMAGTIAAGWGVGFLGKLPGIEMLVISGIAFLIGKSVYQLRQ